MTDPRRAVVRPRGAWPWPGRTSLLTGTVLGVLVSLQAYGYWTALPLWLGPRVVLQPWLLARHGFVEYDQIADMHAPLMPALLSALAPLFSEGWHAARAVLVALTVATTTMTFAAAARDHGRRAGLVAALLVVCWSVPFEAGRLWYESFLAPVYLALLLLDGTPSDKASPARLLAIGLVGGIALLVKQTAIAVVGSLVAWHMVKAWRAGARLPRLAGELGLVACGLAAPALAYLAVHLARGGTAPALWYWLVRFGPESRYATLAAARPHLGEALRLAPAYVLAPAAAWRAVRLAKAGDALWLRHALVFLLLAAASLAIYPRFGAFHLWPTVPLIAWLSGAAVAGPEGPAPAGTGAEFRRLTVAMAAGPVLLWVLTGIATYRPVVAPSATRTIMEFSTVQPLADQVRRFVAPGDTIYVFPDDEAIANLYYLLSSPPPRFWVFHYPWYMTPPARRRVLEELERNPPRWFVHQGEAWDVGTRAPELLAFMRARYRTVTTVPWNGRDVAVMRRVD